MGEKRFMNVLNFDSYAILRNTKSISKVVVTNLW